MSASTLSDPSQVPIVYFSKSANRAHRFLSNFSANDFFLDGRWWPTVEHYYQAQKWKEPLRNSFSTRLPGETPVHGLCPKKIKSMSGKTATKNQKHMMVPIHEFDAVKLDVMRRALAAKFSFPGMRKKLLETQLRPLRHFGRRPDYWDCHCDASGVITKGSNLHGQLMEEQRAECLLQSMNEVVRR